MARFQIEAPDGRTFEIEGETAPTEDELKREISKL